MMNDAKSKPDIQFADLSETDLPGWLKIATDGLEQPAVDRITAEIQNHYADAVAAQLAAGNSEFQSKTLALAELGDPQQAARKLRRSHLTKLEAQRMTYALEQASRPLFSTSSDLVHIAAIVALLIPEIGELNAFSALLIELFIGYRVIPRLLLVRSQSCDSIRCDLALCAFITSLLYWMTFPCVLPVQHPRNIVGGMIAVVISCSLFVWPRTFRVWLKLRRIEARH